MAILLHRNRYIAMATVLTVATAVTVAVTTTREHEGPQYRGYLQKVGGEQEGEGHGVAAIVGGPSSESSEIFSSITSVANARLAPYGSVAAGQLSSSLGSFRSLTSNGSSWSEVTNLPYNADDPNYRDPNFSNSSGCSGYVAGRITGLAAGDGYLFAGGANGGVFRRKLHGAREPRHQQGAVRRRQSLGVCRDDARTLALSAERLGSTRGGHCLDQCLHAEPGC